MNGAQTAGRVEVVPMAETSERLLVRILQQQEEEVLAEWAAELRGSSVRREDLLRQSELDDQCREFIRLLRAAVQSGDIEGLSGEPWDAMRDFLADISRLRVQQGFTTSETAAFIFAVKKPLFLRLREQLGNDAAALADEAWTTTQLLDKLGLYTVQAYQQSREELINRQQQDVLELSTPVVKVWEGVLALPMIGTLDSARTQVVMETLLQRIVETGADIAIIDITGVPTVDTLVAQHLLKTVTAARLMGAECIISGIRPQIAQTIVHLGVELRDVPTKGTLADALALALRRRGVALQQKQQQA